MAVFASLGLPFSGVAQVPKAAAVATESVRARADIARFKQVKTIEELRTVSTASVNRLASELDTAVTDKAKLQRDKDELARQTGALTAEKNALAAEKNKLAQEKADLSRQRDALLAEKNKLAQEKAALIADNEKLRQQGVAISSENTSLEAKNRELVSTQRDLEATKNELVAIRAKLDREIAEQQTRHGTLRAENERLEETGAQLKKDLDWKSLLVKIFSGSTVTGVLAVMGFMVSRRTSVLQNEKLELENERLRREVAAKV